MLMDCSPTKMLKRWRAATDDPPLDPSNVTLRLAHIALIAAAMLAVESGRSAGADMLRASHSWLARHFAASIAGLVIEFRIIRIVIVVGCVHCQSLSRFRWSTKLL
jgi:hypothetical protein